MSIFYMETSCKGYPMNQNLDIDTIIENTRQEILFAIKERIAELTRGTARRCG